VSGNMRARVLRLCPPPPGLGCHHVIYFMLEKKVQPLGISERFAATAAPTKRVTMPCRSGGSSEFGLHDIPLNVLAEDHCQSVFIL